jgi:hypothetical protein
MHSHKPPSQPVRSRSDHAPDGIQARAREQTRILLVCHRDNFANGARAVPLERFLRKRGFDVQVADTYRLSRASTKGDSFMRFLPRLGVRRLALYALEIAMNHRWRFVRRRLSYYLVRAHCRVRQSLLASILPLDTADLVIATTPHDAGVLRSTRSATTLYDCPTPWADELYFDGRLTDRQRMRFRQREIELYDSVDFLAFHWESYAHYVEEHYGYHARNVITLNWGCVPAEERASFDDPLRIVYLGSLGGPSLDLPLLSRLTKLYPHIDVYGGPAPDPGLELNYLGWAPTTILRGYQIGLITSRPDELRLYGFSAKHPQYLAYGLPVLVPASRRFRHLLRGSVPYDEQSFLSVVRGLSSFERWQEVSDQAYEQAQRLAWDETLRPLEAILDAMRSRRAQDGTTATGRATSRRPRPSRAR